MAVSSPKKTQSSKRAATTSAKPAPKTNKRPSSAQRSKSALRPEITGIICIACGLLLMLGLYGGGSAGIFGVALTWLLAGFFGIGAYLSPMLVIGASLIVLLGRSKRIEMSKLVVSAFLFWCVLALVHVSSPISGDMEYESIWKYIGGVFTAGAEGGLETGGLMGAVLGDLLTNLFGGGGRYVVLITAAIVGLVFITGRSFVGLCMRIYDKVDERRIAARERREEEEMDDDDVADEPAIAVGSIRDKKIRARELPARKGGKRQPFDHEIEQGRAAANPDEKLHLFNGGKRNANDYYHIFDKPNNEENPTAEGVSETEIQINEPAAPVEEPIADEPIVRGAAEDDEPESAGAEDESDSGVNVRGVGVEGYTPVAVVDNDDDYVPTGKAKDKDKILQEMSAIEQAARNAMNGESALEAYELPSIDILNDNPYIPSMSSKAAILENSRKLEETLKSFGVEARVVEVSKGPTVTRYELSPGAGVKVSKISGLADDLALSLAAVGIRIEAPIPGKSVVGIEIPNKEVQSVYLKEVISDPAFLSHSSKLSFAVGKDIAGNTVIADIARMPHLLIAGATGSGKSVCINTLITSILYKANPDEVKLLMIDPKVVELSIYNGIPHLIIPVVTDPKKASGALNWAVREMDLRYNMFAETKTRDLKGYNDWREKNDEPPVPQIVIVVDELADLMMTAPGEVEEAICRLAQKARAAGIHLVIATQRPSVDVITGLIKANVPSRLAFAVSSGIDSRTILDSVGAEKLLGKGDMLFSPAGLGKPQRIQGAFISDKEVENLVAFIKAQGEHEYDPALVEKVTSNVKEELFGDAEEDEFLQDAIEYLVEREKASVSNLQRRFRIGYNRASRLMEDLENRGIVGPEDGAKPRKVLMTTYQFMEYKERREQMAADSAMEARQSLIGEPSFATGTTPTNDYTIDEQNDDAPF